MSLNTTPRTWVTSEVVTAAELNTEVRDAFTGIQAAWTAWTPTLTGWTLGNGTLTGTWLQIGKLIFASVSFTFGSTSTTSGDLIMSLPVNSRISTGFSAGRAHILDSSVPARFNRDCYISSATALRFATEADVRVGPAQPMTWAVNDTLTANFFYEAA